MIVRAALALSAVPLLAACGDDLESRQAAVQEQQPMGGEMTVGEQEPQITRAGRAPSPQETAQGFDDEGDPDAEITYETMPDPMVDTAQGFAPDPIDDTSGFDPTPVDPGGFAPEPIGPETFED